LERRAAREEARSAEGGRRRRRGVRDRSLREV
jgi:hypothetical protein